MLSVFSVRNTSKALSLHRVIIIISLLKSASDGVDEDDIDWNHLAPVINNDGVENIQC